MREFLRSLPVFSGVLRDFDVESLPAAPSVLFEQWLSEAVADGVPEPHAMALSTCDTKGLPDARVLILKDVDELRWWFASNSASAKGRQLAERAAAALTFYWPQQGRQVRVRGPVVAGTPAVSAADFRARGTGARAVALASTESQPLADRAICVRAVEQSHAQLLSQPDLVSETWQIYAVVAEAVEFWQADKDRMHTRVQYSRDGQGWARTLLWP